MTRLGPYDLNTIVTGNCLEVLRQIPDGVFQMCATSPPYWKLRDYGVEGQLGLEDTPELYVEYIVEVFREVKRVLRDDGTLWLNMGDSYCNRSVMRGDGMRTVIKNYAGKATLPKWREYAKKGQVRYSSTLKGMGLKEKDLIGIPWRVALALQADGWWLRRDIIWAKGRDGEEELYEEIGPGSSMPESAKDRPISTHEYVFLLSKSARYYYDHSAVRVNWPSGSHELRSVWFINVQGYKEAHFATFPPKLVEPMIKAGTSERGACPECGKAWMRRVAKGLAVHDGKTASAYEAGTSANRLALLRQAARERGGEYANVTKIVGWRPACSCGLPNGFRPDDFELVETPTGQRAGEDPSLVTGRAGYNRPRGANEGKRTITRYEQRKYAEQLKSSPRCAEMEAQAGSAFEHYIRTDKSGARPIPPDLLEVWLGQGWLEQVQVPEWEPPDPVPCIVLDPFEGAGTTLMVADRLGRDWFGIDINPDYVTMSEERIQDDRKKRAQLELF